MELKTLSSFLFSKKGGAGLGLEFDYFYKRDLERFQFFMLPKILVTGEQFMTISLPSPLIRFVMAELLPILLPQAQWIKRMRA